MLFRKKSNLIGVFVLRKERRAAARPFYKVIGGADTWVRPYRLWEYQD